MSLNPIAAIEKLINEHGSATVLRERLSLAADQFTALEKESVRSEKRLVDAEKSLTEATTKIETLEARIQHLETENSSLRSHLSDLESKDNGLHEKEEQVLRFFFDAARDLSADDVIRQFSWPKGEVDHFFGSLVKFGFLRQTRIATRGGISPVRMPGYGSRSGGGGSPAMFRITHIGSDYLMKKA